MILLTSSRDLERAENIKAVFDGYPGAKRFLQVSPSYKPPELTSHAFSLRVTDEFIGESPGHAIMIGHGIAGGKLYGLDQPGAYHTKENARLLDYVVTTSIDMVDLVAKQSGVSRDQVLPLGMPRTDQYFLPRNKPEKRLYLYAPTFRSRKDPPAPVIDWYKIDRLLTDGEIFAWKPHMVNRSYFTQIYKHVIRISQDAPSAPWLMDCAVLITDYSSIMFDAHVLRKPVILFDKTLGYTKTRGMYLKYPDEYASRFCSTEEELIEICRNADKPQEADERCRQLCAGACDGHSTERVVKLIEDITGSTDV